MKKLLLASTALVLSAGVASAQGVALSGDGRMGLVYDGDNVSLNSRARVIFTLSGETDGGLAFGGSFRADNAGAASRGAAGSIFISGDFGELRMGDVDGAALAATGDLHGVGLTGLGDLNEMTYVSRFINGETNATLAAMAGLPVPAAPAAGFNLRGINTGLTPLPRALYTYTIDSLSVYASVAYSKSDSLTVLGFEQVPVGGINTRLPFVSAPLAIDSSLRELAVGAKYEIDGFTVAAGYENAQLKIDDLKLTLGHLTGMAQYSMDGITGRVIVGRAMNDLKDVVETRTQYGASIEATFDATTVTAFARRDFDKTRAAGIGASYDLGGGASIAGGVARSAGTTVADFGLGFKF
ncbi:MAG: porin [Natronohydrobacter sp.]|nr:porin [Natronohydrobacter sp.]